MNIEKAVKHYDEGMAHYRKGKLSDAERAFNKAIKINPDYADAYNDLGNVFMQKGCLKESFNAYRKALRYAPDHPMLLNNIGNVLVMQGAHEKALGWLNKAAKQDPDNAVTHCNLGNSLRGLGNYVGAVDEYRRAIELNPRQAMFFHNLGEIQIELGELRGAVDCYEQALEINPEDTKAWQGLGKVWNALGDLDKAVSSYQKAISIDPTSAQSFQGLGAAYRDHGEIENALSALYEAIEIDPKLVSAYLVLARIRKFTEFDADMKAMEALFSAKELTEKQRSLLAFSLAKAYEDIGEYDKSIELVITAAQLKRKRFDYSISETRTKFDRIKEIFPPDFFSKCPDVAEADQTPIFVIGMPRSGTSLVEQILASHPAVFGAGELNGLPLVYKSVDKSTSGSQTGTFPEGLVGLGVDEMADLGRQYLARLRQYSPDSTYIIDKLPHNFMRVGLIRAALPGARIIHCMREPMDNCLSLFKTDFLEGHPYSYDMTELGQYYRLYLELMDYWRTTLPGFIYDQSYEELVHHQEEQTRRLLKHCDLPWDDACLDFHKTRRKIATASSSQVVRPIYQKSVNLWSRYERHLQPLISSLKGV